MTEQGGWITKSPEGALQVQRWPAGGSGSILIPPKPDSAVASFHTHPYAPHEVFIHGPSGADIRTTRLYGVPDYIIDKQSIMKVDPSGSWSDVDKL